MSVGPFAIEPDGLNPHDGHPMLNRTMNYRVPTLDAALAVVTAIVNPGVY